jgi:hypothetical protein
MINKQQFWQGLKAQINDSGSDPEWRLRLLEQLVKTQTELTLPTQLIVETICNGAVYLQEQSQLNFTKVYPILPLSSQQIQSLEMGLSNSPITVISGLPATGKTRIALNLADAGIKDEKRILILSHYPSTLTAYQQLPGYPYLLSENLGNQSAIIERIRRDHLAQIQLNYLPLYYLPNSELEQLRSPAKLERYLPLINTQSIPQLAQTLSLEFPDLSQARLNGFAYQLKKLEPLLRQQLTLVQSYQNLSKNAIETLAQYLSQNPLNPCLATVQEFLGVNGQNLWQNFYDLIIIEDAQQLTWVELILISGLTDKLVLLGDGNPELIPPSRNQKFFQRVLYGFPWLLQYLLPAYTLQLSEQFRLHPELATTIYPIFSYEWIQTNLQQISDYFPQWEYRLWWEDIPNQQEGEKILEFLKTLDLELIPKIGILTFSEIQRDQLIANCPIEYNSVMIKTVTEWLGKQAPIVLICCSGNPKLIPIEYWKIALTRGQSYLILWGDYEKWTRAVSLLKRMRLPRIRQGVLS